LLCEYDIKASELNNAQILVGRFVRMISVKPEKRIYKKGTEAILYTCYEYSDSASANLRIARY
jgi:hypothetical protein